jgi:hypothetical protein
MRRYWRYLALYFGICEFLYLTFEVGMGSLIGVIASLLFVALTFPAIPVAQFLQGQIASALGLTTAIGYHSFWPRLVGAQSAIVVCAIAIALILSYVAARSPKGGAGDF